MYNKGEAFIPDLVVAHESFKKRPGGPHVVLGLTKGAIHDMGKNVVKIFLEADGFDVFDVGKCAEPLDYYKAVIKHKPLVVGISIPVTTAIHFLKSTIKLIRKADPSVKIVIGGCAIDGEWVGLLGVDGYAPDARSAVDLFRRLCR